ncbi:hypothetical protein NDU88_001914 [Pleurodeles waltl]|uniref:Uncharacterized protein n=1 Tax=Pleurodeles waltl TaxID=8319 RepID=A0AAV7NGH6_PLEWA|nr:hypothetical protein NDU88_001914 [Pleurodeles waltl]
MLNPLETEMRSHRQARLALLKRSPRIAFSCYSSLGDIPVRTDHTDQPSGFPLGRAQSQSMTGAPRDPVFPNIEN